MDHTEKKGKARGAAPTTVQPAEVHPAQRAAQALDMFSKAASGVRQMVLMLAQALPTHMVSPELSAKLAELEEDEMHHQRRNGAWFESETPGPAAPTARKRRGRSSKSRGASSRSKPKAAQ